MVEGLQGVPGTVFTYSPVATREFGVTHRTVGKKVPGRVYIYIYICERGLWGLFGHNTLIHLIHLILQPSRPELNELNELIS